MVKGLVQEAVHSIISSRKEALMQSNQNKVQSRSREERGSFGYIK